MSNVNKAILIGRAGKDPEIRYMTNGEAVANVSLATSESWKDKSGEKQERTEWHNLVFYRRLAEVVGEYVKKGALLYIDGRIQSRKYQDKEGNDRYITEIVVNEMQMLGGKRDDTQQASQEQPQRQAAPVQRQAQAGGSFADMSEDIPF